MREGDGNTITILISTSTPQQIGRRSSWTTRW